MKTTKKAILDVVCTHFNIDREVIISQNRRAEIVKARQFYFYLCRKLTKDSLPNMAMYIKRDHTTALHSIKKIEGLKKYYPDIEADINACEKLLIEINPIVVSHFDLLELTKNNNLKSVV